MSKKSKRSLLSVFIMALVCVFTFTFVGCKDKTDTADQAAVVWTIEKAYAQAQSEGFTGTYEEFLQKLSSISDITIDDVGKLIFTLSNGVVIEAGTITAGIPGRGIEEVRTETDRWGLVVTNTFVFSDGGTTTSSYSTSPMYGREYDIENTDELDYLIENGVKNIILANDVGSIEEDYEVERTVKDLSINLNEKTFYAKNLTLSTPWTVEVSLKNGMIQTAEGLEVSASRGVLTFENVYALDETGEFKLDASNESLHFVGDGCFAKGNFEDYQFAGSPELAKVVIPADTKVVFEENAEIMLERIVVEEVSNSRLAVLNKTHNMVRVEGDVLAYGNVEVVQADEGETDYQLTVATVAVEENIYEDMNDAYSSITNGTNVAIIGDASWNISGEDKFEVSKEFSVYYVEGTISNGNWGTMVVPAAGYVIEEIKSVVEPGQPEQVVGFRFAKCTSHTPVEGYCTKCNAEDSTAHFVAMVGDKKYLSLDKALVAGNVVELISTIELGTAETAYVINKEFVVVKNGNLLTFTNVEYAKDTDEHTAYYLSETEDEYHFILCSTHTYDNDYCTKCGYQDPSKTYVAKIGDREYSSIDSIIAQGHHIAEDAVVEIDLIADTTWTLTGDEIIDYQLTINKNGFDFIIADRYYEYQGTTYDRFFFVDDHYISEDATAFKFVQCPGHVYEKTLEGDEKLYIGYCQICGVEDETLNNAATIKVDGVKYISLQNLVDQGKLVSGIGEIVLLKNANLSLSEEIVVDFELVIDYRGKTVSGDFATKIKAGTGYYIDSTNSSMFKVLACTSHDYEDGTCVNCGTVCGHEEQTGDTCSVCGKDLTEPTPAA